VPKTKIDDTLDMYYEIDSFVEPWCTPEAILLVHGIGGCTTEWYAWVPPLSGKYAVVRVDLRGWGKSTVPPESYTWSMDSYAADLRNFMDKVRISKVHLVGTKLGGRIALHFARAYPDRLHSMTLVCTPMAIQNLKPGDTRSNRPNAADGKRGVERWARASMTERLGEVAPEMLEWWIDLYSKSSPHVISGVYDLAWDTDEYSLLPEIRVPTLVIDSEENLSKNRLQDWPSLIPNSKVAVIPVTTGGRMISASKPAECATALLDFLDELEAKKQS
jgi:pimeloyl-ACP methyl ester carboxylesterase